MYYWKALVEGSGEIMEQGDYPTPQKAAHSARRYIEKSRWFDDSNENYHVSIHEGTRRMDNWDSYAKGEITSFSQFVDGPEVMSFEYRRNSRSNEPPINVGERFPGI